MDERDPHEQIRAGWEIVAAAKYRGEMEDHIELLREGGHTLLPPELELLRDILPNCRRVIVLQCSHGLDALGLLNLGVAEVVGVDISEEMIRQAEEKAETLGAAAIFYRANVLDAPTQLNDTADLVYTGKGSLPWIADLSHWAATVARLLRPAGELFVFEGHPLDSLWKRDADHFQLDEEAPGYFSEGRREVRGFPASVIRRTVYGRRPPRLLERFWRPGQVVGALIDAGLTVSHFDEHPDLYWEQFPDIPESVRWKLPHSYSILAARPATD